MFDPPLHVSDHDIVLKDIALFVESTGIHVEGSVKIADYISVAVIISLTSLGLKIIGAVADIKLMDGVILKNAAIDVFIGTTKDTTVTGPGTSFKFAISGTVSFGQIQVAASLYLNKGMDGRVAWTVYGEFKGALSLAKIAPPLKGTFLDLTLQDACVIASNVDGNNVAGSAIPPYFPVVRGVQVAARLGTIDCLDGAATSGLTLQAIYNAETSSFNLAIILSTEKKISMKDSTVSSGPVSSD